MKTLQTHPVFFYFLIILLGSTISASLAILAGWYSVLIVVAPMFLWVLFKHLKQSTSVYLCIYLLVHLLVSTYLLRGSSFASPMRLFTFFSLVSIVCVSLMFTRKKLNNFKLPLGISFPMFLFLIVLVIGSFYSLNSAQSVQYLIWFAVFILFIFQMIPKEFGSTKSIVNLFYAFILAGFLYEFASLFTLTSTGLTHRGGNIAIRGLFVNNNMMGMIALSISALSIVTLLYKQHLSRGKARLVKLSAMLSIIFVLLSSSRSSIMGLFTVVILLGFTQKRTRTLSVVVLTVAVLLYIFGKPFLEAWFRTDTLTDTAVFGERTFIWLYALQSIGYIPWYGLGIGMQETLYLVSPLDASSLTFDNGDVLGLHNSYLQILIETGIVGFCLFGTILLSTFRKFYTAKDQESRKMISSICAILAGLMVSSFFESGLLLPGGPYSLLFWTLICLVHVVHYSSWKYPIIEAGVLQGKSKTKLSNQTGSTSDAL